MSGLIRRLIEIVRTTRWRRTRTATQRLQEECARIRLRHACSLRSRTGTRPFRYKLACGQNDQLP
jgi:hypothetical protein